MVTVHSLRHSLRVLLGLLVSLFLCVQPPEVYDVNEMKHKTEDNEIIKARYSRRPPPGRSAVPNGCHSQPLHQLASGSSDSSSKAGIRFASASCNFGQQLSADINTDLLNLVFSYSFRDWSFHNCISCCHLFWFLLDSNHISQIINYGSKSDRGNCTSRKCH